MAAPKPAPTNGSRVKITAVVVVSRRVCAQVIRPIRNREARAPEPQLA